VLGGVDKRIEHGTSVVEMRTLRWTSRVIREYRIRNKYVIGNGGDIGVVLSRQDERE
jgi:hypothetical protein